MRFVFYHNYQIAMCISIYTPHTHTHPHTVIVSTRQIFSKLNPPGNRLFSKLNDQSMRAVLGGNIPGVKQTCSRFRSSIKIESEGKSVD